MFLITVDCSPTTQWSGWLQLAQTMKTRDGAWPWRLETNLQAPKFQFTHKLTMNSRHNCTKSKFLAMMHRQWQCKDQSECRLQTEKLLSFMWLTVLRLSCTLHANPMTCVRNLIRYNFEHPKVLKFWEGCVHTTPTQYVVHISYGPHTPLS